MSKPQSSEINNGPGFRIRRRFERPPATRVRAYAEFPTPDISDMLNRMYSMSCEIHNLTNDAALVGPALTVKVFPGDNLMVHKALDLVQPGDVIVVDAAATRNNAVIGDLVASKARHRGAAGVVIDGLVRDLPAMREVDLPVFARGVSPIGPLHRGPGEINYAVSCGGIVVNPGDLIAADRNGVVVVRRDFSAAVLERLRARQKALASYVADVKRGRFSNHWVDQILREAHCDIRD